MFVVRIMKYIWKTLNFVRDVCFNLIFLLIILLSISGYYGLKSMQKETVKPQRGALIVDLEGTVVDNTLYNDEIYQLRNELYGKKIDNSRQNSLFELTEKIAQATVDPNITSMVLKLDNFTGTSLESLQYIGKYLHLFSQANKPIYALGSHFNQSQYYLASYADKVYLTPQGSVNLYGLSATNLYYKTLFDNLKINTHVFRVGTYKSAIEPFIRDDMSKEAKENTTRWLSLMWSNYLTDVTEQRNRVEDKSPKPLVPATDVLLARLQQAKGSMTQYALDNGLVDGIKSDYQFATTLEQAFKQHDQVSIYDYKLAKDFVSDSDNIYTATDKKPLIAVVFVNGTIADGETSDGVAGSQDIVEQLKNIRHNPSIQAVVLRVNSPGGSVTASEAIRSELEALRENAIPVVVSMGGMAASGGYWISTASDYIVANANTITGSIGIFGIIPTFEKSLAHVGVYSDGVTTSPLAKNSLTEDLPDEMNKLMQMNIDDGYHSFISLVADSRKMSLDQVNKIAQGQVWLGQEAKQNGLVDQLGDFDDAVTMAATLAKLSDYRIDWQKPKTTWFNALFSNMVTLLPKTIALSAVEIFSNQLPQVKQLQQGVSLWNKFATDPQNRYIYCLNCADVK
ncbi:signal peptide peptidase SppA [Orbaceae bacterium ESL0727]|nr:signal peptide peptidase SppA [Orbaceae bacterium ESL0727]